MIRNSKAREVHPDHKITIELGQYCREVQRLVAKISRRHPAEPTEWERDRLVELRARITRLRRTGEVTRTGEVVP
jgi:hypothetical protein